MRPIQGVHTALITPFHPDETVDKEGLRQNVCFQLEHAIDGLVILGTTGESPTLAAAEKEEIVRIVSEENRGRALLAIGTGSYSTAQTIENTLWAQDCGADYALVVTPYYNKPTQEGLYRHFKALSKAVMIPLLIYNIAGRTGQNLQTDTLKRLADCPNIIGIKEASGSIPQMMDVLEIQQKQRPDFRVMCGDDLLTAPLMMLGGHGIISVVSNLLPQAIKELVQALECGNYDEARKRHFELMPLFKAAFIETNPAPLKHAMELWGMPAGKCRLPLCELTEENANKLETVLGLYETVNHFVAQRH